MKWFLLLISFSLLIVLNLSCAEDDFREQSELTGLRVLAITADTPEINAAAAVTLTPLISYVGGGNTNLNYSWEACPDPGISFGAEANCDNAPAALGLSGTGTFNTATLAATTYTGNATAISVNIPAAAFTYLATLGSTIQFNGLDYLVFLTYTDPANGNSIKALKRVRLSTKANGSLNTNPSFSNIQFNGGNLTSFPVGKGDMSISGISAPESYIVETNIGPKTFSEVMTVSWFASKGEFLFNRREPGESNEYTPDGTSGVFVAVYRDGRGGVASRVVSF